MVICTFLSSFVWAFHLQQQMASQSRMVAAREAATMISEPVQKRYQNLAGNLNTNFGGKFEFSFIEHKLNIKKEKWFIYLMCLLYNVQT
jgi:hypothetical protein